MFKTCISKSAKIFLISITAFVISSQLVFAMEGDPNSYQLKETVPGSVQTWETTNLAFIDLVSFPNEAIFTKQFVTYAKRDWDTLESAAPSSYDVESPQATRLSPLAFYNKALELFRLAPPTSKNTIYEHFVPNITLLDQPDHFFDQFLVIWCDLRPQLDDLCSQSEWGARSGEKLNLIRFAWKIPAPQIMSRMMMIAAVRREYDGDEVAQMVLSIPSAEVPGRMRVVKELMPSLFPKEGLHYSKRITRELYKYPEEHLLVFRELLALAGHCPNRPFFSEHNTEERALTWFGDWIDRTFEQMRQYRWSYQQLLLGMEAEHKVPIQRLLRHWTPLDTFTFVKTVVVPFLDKRIVNNGLVQIEVGVPFYACFDTIMIALEKRREDIQSWCEDFTPHIETLLLTFMTDHFNLQTREYMTDILGSALQMKPITLKYHCEKMRENNDSLFTQEMEIRDKVGIIMGILLEENSRILLKKLDIMRGILEMGREGETARDRLDLVRTLIWMPRIYIDKLTPNWQIICRERKTFGERVSFIADAAKCENLIALDDMILRAGAKTQEQHKGSIQDE